MATKKNGHNAFVFSPIVLPAMGVRGLAKAMARELGPDGSQLRIGHATQ
jgi:hypothetical protein